MVRTVVNQSSTLTKGESYSQRNLRGRFEKPPHSLTTLCTLFLLKCTKCIKQKENKKNFLFPIRFRYLVYIWFLGTISIAPLCLLRYLESYLAIYFFELFCCCTAHVTHNCSFAHCGQLTKLQLQSIFLLIGVYFFLNFK